MMIANMTPREAAHSGALSLALKQATSELHTRAEKHPVQARMVSGRATRDEYAAFLVQMAALHASLEAALRMRTANVPALGNVVRPYHFREAAAVADLAALGLSLGATSPLSATADFCLRLQALMERDPVSLLGVLYVLEGATNGGRFIAAAVRPALMLPENIGTTYLNPHGQLQNERWSTFRASVDQQDFSLAEKDAVIGAACETFKAVYEILEGLQASHCADQTAT